MSVINYNSKIIHCKVIYYGPSLSGKTTNIQWLYEKSIAEDKSELVELPTDVERTLFFDFLPIEVGEIRGFRTRFHLWSVPGQVVYDASRKMILKGVDGVIFVADSQAERMEENLNSLANLEKHLQMQGYDLSTLPFAIQYNKRDLPNALPISELRSALNKYNAPDFEGTARTGKGVFEAFQTTSKAIVTILKGGEI